MAGKSGPLQDHELTYVQRLVMQRMREQWFREYRRMSNKVERFHSYMHDQSLHIGQLM